MLYKEYEPEVLKKLQRAEIEILKDFDALCLKYGIEYFACGGTAIGGVRHGGFIPWDDDIDLGMTREHYDHFLKVAEKEYDGKYKIMNPEVDSRFSAMLTKWYRTNTVFCDKDAIMTGVNVGISIDIFCFDNVADDIKSLRRQAFRSWTWGKLFILRSVNNPTLYVSGIKAQITLMISKVMNGLLRFFHVSPAFLYNKAKKAATAYKDVDTERVGFLFDPTPFTSLIKRKDIYPIIRRPFEDIEISYPKNVEKYLCRRYGDNYMQLPPEDQRHNHAPEKLDFGEEFADL